MLPINQPKSLYPILQEHLNLLHAIEDADGEITPEVEAALQVNQENLQIQAISIAQLIKVLDYNQEILKAEMDRLYELKKKAERTREYFKHSLAGAMQLLGIERVECPVMKISLRSSQAVEITQEKIIPPHYFDQPAPVVSKKRISEALKDGVVVPGAELVKRKHLQIK